MLFPPLTLSEPLSHCKKVKIPTSRVWRGRGEINTITLGKVPGAGHYSVNASFPSGPHLQTGWRLLHACPRSRLRDAGDGRPGGGAARGPRVGPASAQPRGGAPGCCSALYGSSFAPEVVPWQGWVRSGHGGAEVGKMALRGWAHRGWGCGQAWAPPGGGRSYEELSAALAPPRLLGRR